MKKIITLAHPINQLKNNVHQRGIVLEDNCWIGMGLIIHNGAKIGTGSVTAAGTVALNDIPPNSIVIDKRDKMIKQRMDN